MPSAYLTGGASGIGRATAQMLVKNGISVFIADRDITGAEAVVAELNKSSQMAFCAQLDAADWKDQAKIFGQAVAQFGRIDYVYPIAGIGERAWMHNDPNSNGFEMPDLSVLDIDLTGVLYTASLAIQQFRRQEVGKNGLRGSIGCVASVCGFYCCPTLPIYTAAKHGVTGFVRSFGKYLPEEKIQLNAVMPNVVATNISTSAFYDQLIEKDILTPLEGVIDVFENLLKDTETSGECFEVGPQYKSQGPVKRPVAEYLDDESKQVFDLLYERGHKLHQPI